MIVVRRFRRVMRARPQRPGACALALLALVWVQAVHAQSTPVSIGGNLAATTDYIYRGVSQSDGQGALQADVHLSSAGGTFGGVWASTRDRSLDPRTPAELQVYLGQRFSIDSDWSASLSGRADYFVGAPTRHSDDYQELAAALTWLDRCTVSLTVLPDTVRYTPAVYVYENLPAVVYYRTYRSTALVGDASSQQLLREGVLGGGLYLTAGAGYYYSSRPEDRPPPALGYLYGNLGLALERRRWRIDAGYFTAQNRAAQLFPYPVARRFAGTISWQF